MRRRLNIVFNLARGTDKEGAMKEIASGVKLQGFHVWILICSALLASIGLNTNSVAVIIGAMLISPLMSPILGIGLSMGIHDKELFFQSMRNFLVAILLSLGTSILFFLATPLKESTSELLSRTYPTLLDVLIAFVGGVAGIVAISRRDKTNAIPGVAIATALMPPLCTAGYGLATMKLNIFFGAFYLFVLNAIFISLATFFIVKYLKFPVKIYMNKPREKLYSRWSALLLLVAIVPSGYFLYKVYNRQAVKNQIQAHIIDKLENEGREIIKWNLLQRDKDVDIKIYYSGKVLSPKDVDSMQNFLSSHKMGKYILKPFRMNITRDEVNELSAEVANDIFAQMVEQNARNIHVVDTLNVYKEVSLIIPGLDSPYIINTLGVDSLTRFSYATRVPLSPKLDSLLNKYLLQRLYLDTIITIPRIIKK